MPYCQNCNTNVGVDTKQCPSCNAPLPTPSYRFLESRLSAEQERTVRVPNWLSVSLALFSIGGAAWGLLATAMLLIKGGWSALDLLFVLAFAALFCFGAWSGVWALQKRHGWLRLSKLFWATQIVAFSSPVISYQFFSGAVILVTLKLTSIGVGAHAYFGSQFSYSLFRSEDTQVGLNVLALSAFLFLRKQEAAAARVHTTASTP